MLFESYQPITQLGPHTHSRQSALPGPPHTVASQIVCSIYTRHYRAFRKWRCRCVFRDVKDETGLETNILV